jgi:hypothetical protein
MSRIFTLAMMLTACLALAAGCKDDAATKTGTGSGTATGTTGGSSAGGGAARRGPATSASATKEGAVMALQEAAAALDAKDYDKALEYFHIPPGATPEKFKEAAPGMVEKQEISKDGVEVLASKGNWGPLAEVFTPERAKSMAERAGVPEDQCYGLTHENAEAGFHWNGQDFKIIRCNNVGKLKK